MRRFHALFLIAICLWPVLSGAAELSRAERKERLQKLSDQSRQFLLDVEPIIESAERDLFLTLESDAQREVFVADFWKRHAPKGVSADAFKAEYYERVAFAGEKYHRSTDRYRTYVVNGAPDQVIDPNCRNYLVPLELWKYFHLPTMGRNVTLLFYVPRQQNEYVLWHPIGQGMTRYDDLLTEVGHDQGIEKVFLGPIIPGTTFRDQPLMDRDCMSSDVLHRAIDDIAMHGPEQLKALAPVPLSEEPMKLLLKSMVVPNKEARRLMTEVTVGFPRKTGNRIDTEITILLRRAELTLNDVEGARAYSVDVTGEVLHNESMYESYRYRFDLPGDSKDEKLPVVVDRMLPHGDYRFRLKVTDVKSGAEAIIEKDVTVPDTIGASAVVDVLKHQIESSSTELRIAPLPGEIQTGIQHIETIAVGDDIKAVEFYLDGHKVMTKRQPPYTLDLDFGSVPQVHRVRALALDAKGQPITGDELILNTGTDPFRVRIVSPRIAIHLKGRTRVEMAVDIPQGKKLDKLELYWNEKRVATLYEPPFVQMVDVPPSEGVAYFRAVASLKDDPTPPVEDIVFVNTPQFMEEVNVHLIELPTTVTVNGRRTTDLPASSFQVFDEGQPVKLAKFEQVKNLPLSIGMAIDASGSMQPRLSEAQKAGALFFNKVLKAGDKAFLLSFDSQPRILQPWSSDLAVVNAGLMKLRAEEATALYDAIVYSLYNFSGVRGQRALVLITDGEDTASKFTYDQALEYARRAAVPVYAIGLAIKSVRVDVRYQLGKLCTETGGAVYFIDHADQLTKIYNDIEEELRSQYLLGFYPPEGVKPGSKWREVSVVTGQGKAKTIRGYYP